MKVKQSPEDFVVEELTDVVAGERGPFAFYRLSKTGWGTPEALQAVRRRWNLGPGRLDYGGLKDRHARTTQYFTIFHGPRRGLKHHTITVEYLGQVPEPYSSRSIRANRFAILVRSLSERDVERAETALTEVREQGFVNYFDDQRFGSVGTGREFVGRLLALGRFEDALKLALTGAYEYDTGPQKREKQTVRSSWGDWAACKQRLPKGHAHRVVDYLAGHPRDFRGAVAHLRPEPKSLYLSAFQSHVWNRMVARWLRQHCPPESLTAVRLRLGGYPMHRGLATEALNVLRALRVPLPTARWHPEPGDAMAQLANDVLADDGLRLDQLRVRGVRDLFFSKGERTAVCFPEGLTWRAEPDERHSGRQMLLLQFELPPGAYATLVLKRAGAAR